MTARAATRCAALFAACAAAGCAAPSAAEGTAGPVEATSLDEAPSRDVLVLASEDGLSAPLALPTVEGGALALWARAEPGRCFALSSLGLDATFDAAAIAHGAALFVLPGGEPTVVRFALLDCVTRRPVRPDVPLALEVGWSPRASSAPRGRIAVRFVVSRHSMLSGRPELRVELAELLARELDEAAIDVTFDDAASVELPDAIPPEARFWSGGLGQLDAMLALAGPPARATVDVVFAGCLVYDDPHAGAARELRGFTPRVGGGGGGPADAVFAAGRRCDSFREGPEPWPVDAYAHLLAHELGHFLGLAHTVEADATTDTLGDTAADNTMHHQPDLASSRGWSPMQSRTMRAHPWAAW